MPAAKLTSMKSTVCSGVHAPQVSCAALGGEPGEDETGDEEMSAEQTTGRVPQFMLECFREDFYASLGDVVGWVTGRGGDPLF